MSPMRPDDAQRLSTGVNNRRLQIAKNIRCGDCLISCKKAQLTFNKSSVGRVFLQLFRRCFTTPDKCCCWSDFTIVHTCTFLIAHPCSSREGMGHFKQPWLFCANIHWRRRWSEYFDFHFVFRSSWLLSFSEFFFVKKWNLNLNCKHWLVSLSWI